MKQVTILTKEQRDIINFKERSILVQASAGCGKTTTITYLIDHKMNTGIQPKHITVLSYNANNVAVIKEKLTKVTNGGEVNCKTIHSFSKFLVENYHHHLNLTKKPDVVSNSNNLLTRITQQILKIQTGKEFAVTDVKVKQLLKSVKAVRSGFKQITSVPDKALVKAILTCYKKIGNKNNIIDFYDMVNLAIELIKKSPEVRIYIKKNIQILIADEVQDINRNQARLLVLLSKCVKSSVFVGDEKQNINQFQGTRQGLSYLKEKINLTLYPLSISFRIPKQALALVNKVAEDLDYGKPVSSTGKGFRSRLYLSQNNDEQFKILIAEINRLVSGGTPLNQIAILGRTYSTLTNVAYSLVQRGIPVIEDYNTIGNNPFEMVKSVLEVVKWYSEKNGTPPVKAITYIVRTLNQPNEIQRKLIRNIVNKGWKEFKISGKDNPTLSRKVSNLRKKVIHVAENSFEMRKNIQILCSVVKPLVTLNHNGKLKPSVIINRDFSLIIVALSQYLNWEDMINNFPSFNADNDNSIQLTTCHAAKGREWQYVFLINVVNGTFPYLNSNEEDERKLFYVAITRSSKGLIVIESPNIIFVNGKHRKMDKTSPFVNDYECEFKILTLPN